MLALALLLASGSAQPQAAPPPGFACTATGTRLLVPAMAPEAACARLRQGLARAGTRLDRANIQVALRFEKPGIATARVTRGSGAGAVTLPDISVATSDRAMGPLTIDLLAREIAARLARR